MYDAFYPGYGASWPSYYGGLAMTYENGSTRGLVVRRNDETTITFRQTVRRHFVASISTCETASQNREKLLDNFWQYHVTALSEAAQDPVKEFIFPRTGNVGAVDRLASLMLEHGLEVKRATAAFQADGKEMPAGSYVIPLEQPARRMAHALLDPIVSMADGFLKEEDARRKRRRTSEIYDVTAWSLPLQFGVDLVSTKAKSAGSFEAVTAGKATGKVIGKPTVAFLVPWGSSSAAHVLTEALKAGVRVHSSDRRFVLGGRTYPAGTLIIKVKDNIENVVAVMNDIVEASGAEVFGTESGWVDEGPNFGSYQVQYMGRPRIALAWDAPTGSGSAGQLRFVLERQFGYPVTVIRTQQLAFTDLSKFNVLLLPDGGFGGGYGNVLGANGARRIKDWVQTGGTLIGIGAAIPYMASNGLLGIQQENATVEPPPSGSAAKPAQPGDGRVAGKNLAKPEDLDKALQPDSEPPSSAHGFLARVTVDQDYWLTAGVPRNVFAMVQGRSIYSPVKADRGINAAYFSGPEDVVASGYLWDEYRKQIAYKPFVVIESDGRGYEIAFTADPNFRAYMDGLNILFLNAVFRAPAHALSGGGLVGEQEENGR